ncbi:MULTISPECIES: NAD(+) diphosphatase [unclassified Duganella]|uniref:NAD(+) diphosphatase n=1 Tax=unclassified Duganella TaxID=2636909 RepID=UPI000E343BD4|nr:MULTISPECIES: NAD(+) diphosphatase [unclassified Duganella]RFP08063.1 NAD(+) diphosphatase [Duganella sp. BJB475]RFP23868.1 NAD(+) diphosphatase [Duganella sp. BJB476]
MLLTPATFTPLIRPRDHDYPLTFVFHRGELLLRNEILGLPDRQAVAALKLPPERFHALGEWEGRYYQLAWVDQPELPGPEYGYHGLRSLFGLVDDGFAALAGRAFQLADWARTHRYCGACATPMRQLEGERCYQCPACGMSAYPRISPAMMVLIRKGEQVLLAMHSNAPYKRYTALAGFLEAGESIEEAVHREVYEEVGLRVRDLKYFGSQSWPFPHSLMIAYTAEYLDGEIRVDPTEIADARWFGPGDPEWPDMTTTVSIAAALLKANRPGG